MQGEKKRSWENFRSGNNNNFIPFFEKLVGNLEFSSLPFFKHYVCSPVTHSDRGKLNEAIKTLTTVFACHSQQNRSENYG